jgi:hypothetical protein
MLSEIHHLNDSFINTEPLAARRPVAKPFSIDTRSLGTFIPIGPQGGNSKPSFLSVKNTKALIHSARRK